MSNLKTVKIMEVHDCKKEYASKGIANAGLVLGITGTALGLMNNNVLGRGLFGGNCGCNNGYNYNNGCGCGNDYGMYLERKECKDYLDITEKYYQGRLETQKNLSDAFTDVNDRLTRDAFGLYKNQRDGFDTLSERIAKLETKQAIADAVEPWRAKVLDMQLNQVNSNAANGIALEAERRCCADNKIVNYVNGTFVEKQIGTVSAAEPFVPAPTYNPLCGCC